MEYLSYIGLAVLIVAIAWIRAQGFARRCAPRGRR